jgi:hypothetical protein
MTPTPQPIDYGRTPRRHASGMLFLLSTGMACLFAFAFLFVQVLMWHIANKAYSLSMVFDGQLLGVVLTVGFASGIVVFVPFYLVVRSKPLGKSMVILITCVLAELVIATPFNNRVAFVGSFVAFAFGLAVVWFLVPPLRTAPTR